MRERGSCEYMRGLASLRTRVSSSRRSSYISDTVSCGLSWFGSLGTQYQASAVNSASQSSNFASSSRRAS